MKCVICKSGETTPGSTRVTLNKGETTVLIKDVPADICDQCDEYYLDESVAAEVTRIIEDAVEHGVELEILRYAA